MWCCMVCLLVCVSVSLKYECVILCELPCAVVLCASLSVLSGVCDCLSFAIYIYGGGTV